MGRWHSALPGGVCPPLPQGQGPGLASRFPSCVRVLSCCACLLWSGKKNGMTSQEGEDYLAFLVRALDAFPCTASVRSQWVLRTAGRQPSRVLLSS